MDELTIDDKTYISSKRAAQITGYAKDYVGQLCREGRVAARLVGRNWYVLEDSIREHRFGAPEAVSTAEINAPEKETVLVEPKEEEIESEKTWESARYASEEPQMVPPLAPKPPEVNARAVAEMQSAWQEWFSERAQKSLPAGDSMLDPELLPVVTQESVQEPVASSYVEDEAPVAVDEPVAIHRAYTSIETGEVVPHVAEVMDLSIPAAPTWTERPLAPHVQTETRTLLPTKPRRQGSMLVLRMVLIAVALLAGSIAVIGSGNAERFIHGSGFGSAKSHLIEYLEGTREYKSI